MTVVINGTTGITNPDGTAAAPALTGTDTNTGIFFPAADTIAFSEGGVEALRIDSSGNLGIGTTPSEKCHIYASSGNSFYKFQNAATGSGASDGGFVGIGSSGDVFLYNYEASNTVFSTNNAERMRITNAGDLLVGATTQYQTEKLGVTSSDIAACLVGTNPGNITVLQIRRANTDGDGITFFRGTTQRGYISVDSTGTTYNTLSDYRLKENVRPMVGALAKVSALKPVTYDWKDIGKTGQGFIAHELKEIVPECVTREKDELDDDGNPRYQGVDTSFLVATLTAAIQELKALVDAQAARITALEGTP